MSLFPKMFRGHKPKNYTYSEFDPRYRAMNFSNLSMTGGGGNAVGTQTLPELGGGYAMGDPMQSSIARRRQRLAGAGVNIGGASALPDKSLGG